MSKLLSIIIPVYKVEAYVEQCLRSCVEQETLSPDDYEIVVINDGTPDNSWPICERLAEEFPQIRLFTQPNSGVSVARNKGINEAEGDFVWFVDSDDWIEPGCLCKMLDFLRKHPHLDILYIHGQVNYEDGRVDNEKYRCIFEGEMDGPELIRRSALPTTPQWCLYRREHLLQHQLYFFPGIYHEDSEFIPRAAYVAKHIACLDVLAYHLRRGSRQGTTAIFRMKNAMDTLVVMRHLYDYAKELPLPDKQGFYRLISRTMNNILFGAFQLTVAERKILYKELKQHAYLFDAMRHSGRRKYQLEGCLLKMSIPLAFRLCRIIK